MAFAGLLPATGAAQSVTNTATIALPDGVSDPQAGNNTATDSDALALPELTLAKVAAGSFTVGINGVYTLTLSNASAVAPTAGTITVTDTLPAGLSYVSATGTGWTCGAAGALVTCTTDAVLAPGTAAPDITLTVAVDDASAPNVTNTARASGGGDTTCPASGATQARCTPSATTPVSTAAIVDFCPANTVWNITQGGGVGRFYRYDVGTASDVAVPELDLTVAGNLNGLMVDPVRNRLLFISYAGGQAQLWVYDAANGGWYAAAAPLASDDIPRAGVNQSGVGYLMTGGASPRVYRVEPTGAFDYAIVPVGNLSYDVAPTDTGSGDIAFDAGGNAWMAAGVDVYKIDLSGPNPVAVRQQRPLLNGAPSTLNWAGVAFGTDGNLYVATNTPPSRYFSLDLGTGTLTPVANTTANQARDLASCAIPAEPQPAQLQVEKTLASVNGAPHAVGDAVSPGDVLTYDIRIRHAGGDLAATLFAGDVVDALPANTTPVTGGNNDFACTGANCANADDVNIPQGGSETLNFVVRVDDPLPSNVSTIANAVAVKGVDCTAAGNDCEETTPVAPVVTVAKASDPGAGTTVNPGQAIEYTLTVTVANAATTSVLTLVDTLTGGQAFTGSPTLPTGGSCTPSGTTMQCTLAAASAPGTYVFRYTAVVAPDATGSIGNSVVPSGDDAPACVANACQTTHPIIDTAVTVAKISNPGSGAVVDPGSEIEYTLTVTVANSATTGVVTLTDTLTGDQAFTGTPVVPAGGNCAPSGSTMQCTLQAGSLPGTYAFRYRTLVDAAATGALGNTVVPSGGDDPTCGSCNTTHTVVPTAVTVAKSSNPGSGAVVNPGTEIEYTLTVTVANSVTTGVVTLVDTLTGDQAFTGTPTVPAGGSCTPSGNAMQCTLQAGSLPGTYAFRYRTRIDDAATGALGNNVVPSGPDDPGCVPGGCGTTHTVVDSAVTVNKSSNPGSGAVVDPGSEIEYVLTVTVANSATTDVVTLNDTLTGDQAFTGTPVVPAGGNCAPSGSTMQCTLQAGSLPGTYAFRYRTLVDAAATGALGNAVVPSGGDDPTCGACGTNHSVVPAVVTVAKASNPGSGSVVEPGDEIEYLLTVTVENSATTGVVTLADALTGAQAFTGTPTVPAGGSCTPSGNTMQCTLQAGSLPGSYEFRYRTVVADAATGTLGNTVTPSGPDDPGCAPGACGTTHAVVPSAVTVSKSSNPASGTQVAPNDPITYTLTVNVANSATTGDVTLTDTLSPGQTVGALPSGCSAAGQAITCVLAAGALPGGSPYTFVYTATVDAGATGTIGNVVVPAGTDNPSCAGVCETEHTIVPTEVTVSKSSNPASGTQVEPNDTIEYTLTAVVANSATTAPVTLTDTLSAGQTLGTLPAGCSASGRVVTCTLPAGSLPNTYTFAYAATVDADATGTIGNTVVPSGADDPSCAPDACATEHPIVPTAVTVSKSSNPASGTEVEPGDTITYTLSVEVANSATTADVVLTDTLSAGQTLGTLPSGCAASGQVVTCTLPAGTLPNTYTFVYAATVDADATGDIGNVVVPSGTDNPTCQAGACETAHSVVPTRVTVVKSSDPASGSPVNASSTIRYTLAVTVENSATTSPVVLTDTLSGAQSLTGEPAVPAGGACTVSGESMACTLPAGTLPGVYEFRYSAVVAASASGTVRNTVAASGGGDDDPVCTACSTEHPIAAPVVEVAKAASPGDGATVNVGDTIEYTLSVTIENAAITEPVTLTDTPGAGLTIGTLPQGCAMSGSNVLCTLPAGTVPGTYTFVYPATVNADAGDNVANTVAGAGGGGDAPGCTACATRHQVVDAAQLRIVKQASPRDARIGDLVRYTLTIENVGPSNVTDAMLIDTPPPGFSLVADSLTVSDADGAGRLVGTYPIRVDRLDVRTGEHATVQYLLRVGAGVRPGIHVNRVHAEDGGRVISNEATAEVQLVADPLIEESLLLGTVYDDRDGDGWQDSARLTGVRVQGGFAPGAYVAQSSTIDSGRGPQPLPDASAPLLHGVDVGAIPGRQSEADPVQAHTVTIGQTLRSLEFTDDFVLTSDQGVRLRMDAAGNTRVERSGEAARGLTAAEPRVERRVSRVEGGYRVDYLIGNAGIEERGIPGVRIASVEGLLIETDQFGRYHLEGVQVGSAERGNNFILKVDPATLPPGTEFTTDNPLVRRITQGLPVRFDFGAKLPSGLVEGGRKAVEMQLGEVMFDPGSAQLRAEDAPVVEEMAEQVRAHGGGEVVIAASGDQVLAYDRAQAVRTALFETLPPELAGAVAVELRSDPDDPASALVSIDESQTLGTILFDTDSAAIRAEYMPLIERIAAEIERMRGGVVSVTGHADRRGSDDYNAALGLRRAQAVFEAISAKLGPEARARLRVALRDEPAASVGTHGR